MGMGSHLDSIPFAVEVQACHVANAMLNRRA